MERVCVLRGFSDMQQFRTISTDNWQEFEKGWIGNLSETSHSHFNFQKTLIGHKQRYANQQIAHRVAVNGRFCRTVTQHDGNRLFLYKNYSVTQMLFDWTIERTCDDILKWSNQQRRRRHNIDRHKQRYANQQRAHRVVGGNGRFARDGFLSASAWKRKMVRKWEFRYCDMLTIGKGAKVAPSKIKRLNKEAKVLVQRIPSQSLLGGTTQCAYLINNWSCNHSEDNKCEPIPALLQVDHFRENGNQYI